MTKYNITAESKSLNTLQRHNERAVKHHQAANSDVVLKGTSHHQ